MSSSQDSSNTQPIRLPEQAESHTERCSGNTECIVTARFSL